MGTELKIVIDSQLHKIVRLESGRSSDWKRFVEESNTGTLFHDLDFLAYHDPQRFAVEHLMIYKVHKLVSVLPAAVVAEKDGTKYLKSPYGASIGGPVFPLDVDAESALDMVRCVQDYAREQAYGGIEFRIGPSVYNRVPNQLLNFCLRAAGFNLTKSMLLHVAPLHKGSPDFPYDMYSKSKRYDIKNCLKKGLKPAEAGIQRLDEFYGLLLATQERHCSKPTHQIHELRDLMSRLPERVRLFLCDYEGNAIAGILVFMLNRQAAYTFYICSSYEHRKLCGAAVLSSYIIEALAREGLRFLDFGPSSFDDFSLNTEVAFFKEGLGGQGFCRETWRWVA